MNRWLARLAHHFRKRLKGRYIIIESDDWGLERARSEQGIEWAAGKYGVDKFTRWTTDALETEEDIRRLYEVLDSFHNSFQKGPVITANFVMFNIDADTSHQLSYRSLLQLPQGQLDLYKQGIERGVLMPQFHGFSHFNTTAVEEYSMTSEWLEDVANEYPFARTTLKGNLAFLQGEYNKANKNCALQFQKGMMEFQRAFGFDSISLIPPTYVFDNSSFGVLRDGDIRYLQAGNRITDSSKSRYLIPVLRKWRGLTWGIRNARLDPHADYNYNHRECLDSIHQAFRQELPAVIDFHRVNFSGRFTPDYRQRTLDELDQLLEQIQKRWPDVEFISTPQLVQKLYGT